MQGEKQRHLEVLATEIFLKPEKTVPELMITKDLANGVGALERKRQVSSRGRDGTLLLKAAFV